MPDLYELDGEMKNLRSYSSPFNLGHKALADLFDGKVIVQEKIDGSQFSFGVRDGELFCRSRNQQIDFDDSGMFALAVATAKDRQSMLEDGWTYRSEFLAKPKQNTLVYDRVPIGNVILFDIDAGDQDYLPPNQVSFTAEHIGLEYTPTWTHIGKPSMDQLNLWLEQKSILGNATIEGLVFKNYSKYGPDKKVLMGKYVSEKFREEHGKDWKQRNPGQNLFLANLVERYATEARWAKARQHLREAGELINAPQDIPLLLREANRDVLEECGDEIKEALFEHFWRQVSKGLTRGLPEWYKEQLAKEALDTQ